MSNDIFLAKTTDRKEWYRLQIEHYIKKIPLLQTEQGAFNKNIEAKYNPSENARLQEGVLPLAWHMHHFGTQNYRDNIVKGLRYVFRMKRTPGAYPATNG